MFPINEIVDEAVILVLAVEPYARLIQELFLCSAHGQVVCYQGKIIDEAVSTGSRRTPWPVSSTCGGLRVSRRGFEAQ